MSEKVMTSDSELYNNIVEMLSNGNFLQLNGKAINLTELNEYINAQQEEIERLKSIITEVREYILQHCEIIRDEEKDVDMVGRIEGIPLLEILDKEEE